MKDTVLIIYLLCHKRSQYSAASNNKYLFFHISVCQESGHGLVWCVWLRVSHESGVGRGCSLLLAWLGDDLLSDLLPWLLGCSGPLRLLARDVHSLPRGWLSAWLLASPRVERFPTERGWERERQLDRGCIRFVTGLRRDVPPFCLPYSVVRCESVGPAQPQGEGIYSRTQILGRELMGSLQPQTGWDGWGRNPLHSCCLTSGPSTSTIWPLEGLIEM